MRNDLYITLEKGEFEKGGKSVARNVEVTVYALDADGQILKVFRLINVLITYKYTLSWLLELKNTWLRSNKITLKITFLVSSWSKSCMDCFHTQGWQTAVEVERWEDCGFLYPLILSVCWLSLQGFVAVGSGEPGEDEYHTFVLYHNNSPRWAELIKLPIPVDMFRGSHVRFEFRHCSSKSETAENRHCSFCSLVYDAFNITEYIRLCQDSTSHTE